MSGGVVAACHPNLGENATDDNADNETCGVSNHDSNYRGVTMVDVNGLIANLITLCIGMWLLRRYYKSKANIAKRSTQRLWLTGALFFIVGSVANYLATVLR